MKIESYVKDPMSHLDLKSKLWNVFDILRSDNISSEYYHLILFFLSLFKDEIVTSEILTDKKDIKDRIIAVLHKEKSDKSQQYLTIYQNLEPTLKDLSNEALFSIFQVLKGLDFKVLTENFPEIFDSVLYRIAQSQGRYGGEFIQPIELTRLICGLIELPENAKIFNPFAGLASFGVFFNKGQDYYGQELNQKTWALGALRIMAYERSGSSEYLCEDSILHWPDESKKFDLIVSNPPYGLRLSNQYRDIEPGIQTVDQFLIKKSLNSLTNKGKLIALLPQSFLIRGKHEQRLREFLVDEDLINTIISIPGGLLLNTGVPLIILVIDKQKKLPGKVRFIKADKFVETKNPRRKILNDYALNGLIHSNRLEEGAARIADIRQIQVWDYNLNVPRYFQKAIIAEKGERLVKLKDVLEYVSGHRGNLPDSGKLVRIRDLKDDKVDFQLNVSGIEEMAIRRPGIHQLSESCLLLAIRWRTLKPTFFKYDGEPIFRNKDILTFKVDESISDYAYVINELHSDYVQEQLESHRMGATIPFIRRDDLLEVVIKLPPLEVQQAKVQGIIELSNEIKILQGKINSLLAGEHELKYEKTSSLKHRLGTPLLNIGSSLRNIEKALNGKYSSWEDVKLNDRFEVTLKDSFYSIYQQLDLVHTLLINNESEIDFSNKKLEVIDFLSFIKRYVRGIKSAEKANVKTILDIHPDIKIQLDNKVFLIANAELLQIALNAIVENARIHAFTDDSNKYKLEFRVSLYVAPSVKNEHKDTDSRFDTYIKVEVANNGKPFPENYSIEKLTRKNSFAGETGKTGQGGFDLNEIIKYHNNDKSTLELITDDFTTEFITTYSFLIPFNR